jgi:DnaJ-class molecular chaperone
MAAENTSDSMIGARVAERAMSSHFRELVRHAYGGEAHAEWEICPRCNGSGQTQGVRCPRCDGNGKIRVAVLPSR